MQTKNINSGHILPLHNRRKRRKTSVKPIAVGIVIIAVLIAFVVTMISSMGEDGSSDVRKTKTQSGVTTEIESETEEIIYPVERGIYTDSTAEFAEEFTFENGIVIDLEDHTVLAAKNADEKIYPASLTKIMTLIVAVEKCEDLNETFTMTAEIIDPLIIEEASMAGFVPDEEVAIHDMLYGLMLPSGADAAVGLAYHIAGSEEAFASLMNEKAKELGLKGTHFTNCSGLHDEDHYSTCQEIAIILEYAMKNELMYKILSTYQYTTASTEQHPEGILLTDTMFSRMYGNEPVGAFIIGGKTGYTIEAKNCLASFAVKCEEGESEDITYSREPSMLLVTVGSVNKWGPVYDAFDIYSTFADENISVDGVVEKITQVY